MDFAKIENVEHKCDKDWITFSIESAKERLVFKIASKVYNSCCEEVDIKYEGSQIEDLVRGNIITLDINVKEEELPRPLVRKLKDILIPASSFASVGYIVSKVTFITKYEEEKVLYIIFTNTNINYAHQVLITRDDNTLFQSWV